MTRPDWCPVDVWSEARGCFCAKELTPAEAPLTLARIARAILAERERCENLAMQWRNGIGSGRNIAAQIRAGTPCP